LFYWLFAQDKAGARPYLGFVTPTHLNPAFQASSLTRAEKLKIFVRSRDIQKAHFILVSLSDEGVIIDQGRRYPQQIQSK
jgi:hypothetical protein